MLLPHSLEKVALLLLIINKNSSAFCSALPCFSDLHLCFFYMTIPFHIFPSSSVTSLSDDTSLLSYSNLPFPTSSPNKFSLLLLHLALLSYFSLCFSICATMLHNPVGLQDAPFMAVQGATSSPPTVSKNPNPLTV